ncbi:MAG: hypothetical protein JSS49_27125 [Planctomycetes bacterium]|nr:hypothetical protein [Planctomycetota bacterium]
MTFPMTRHTLIHRLSQGGNSEDWQSFLRDYWGAVCRFARNTGHLSVDDAEDVASEVFEAILRAHLLQRWSDSRTAKLRTLICSVVRNVLANRTRTDSGRDRIIKDHSGQLDRYQSVGHMDSENGREHIDAFGVAWAESLVKAAADDLLQEYNMSDRGDYFRILYGKLCEDLSAAEIARALQIPVTSVDNYYRHARNRLGKRLEHLVRSHVDRYCYSEDVREEFATEWNNLKMILQQIGGLESTIRKVYTVNEWA